METAGALPSQAAVARPERDWPRMDTPNVLWFFGAYAIAFATLELINNVPEAPRDVWELLVSLGVYAAHSLGGWVVLRSPWVGSRRRGLALGGEVVCAGAV